MRILTRLAAALLLLSAACASANPVSPLTERRLGLGQGTWVVVEYDGASIDRAATGERLRRGLRVEDDAILTLRRQSYRQLKQRAESAVTGTDITGRIDYQNLPLQAWRLTSVAALARLKAGPGVLRIHENAALHPVSVSDLGFIRQPQAAATGGTGAGTTIAVIDGGLGTAYKDYADFGPCTAVGVPSTCRVVVNKSTYPGQSAETNHGTNVAAIALGTAPAARLAHYDVFNGSSASSADIIGAINDILSIRSTYNIVALNLSLGDSSSNATPCTTSVFASALSGARAAGILTAVAAGNNGSKTGIADPACVPDAVSVGAVYDDRATGTWQWKASAATDGTCTQTSVADRVTCFSQSSPFLSLLAPGSFVAAPDSTITLSGTSQAAPHLAGAIAVLRARYPAEPLATTLQRLQSGGVPVTDPANGRTTPRLDLLGALQLGTSLSLSGSGPTGATAGSSTNYTLLVANGGPLVATNVVVSFTLPAGASFVSGSQGCSVSAGTVRCLLTSLNAGGTATFTVTLHWSSSSSAQITATASADQSNSATPAQQSVTVGGPAATEADAGAPLPLWTWLLLAAFLILSLLRNRPTGQDARP